MANDKQTKGKKTKKRATMDVSTLDNIRLVSGFVLMLFGAFLFFSVLSYFFYWKEDMSALAELGKPMANPEFNNICGEWGAKVASGVVGGGFGLFSIIFPIVLCTIGWRLFRYKPLRLHKFLLIYCIVLVLGSLTFGFFFGTSWGVFGSGLGGEYGIALDNYFCGVMGSVGTLLLIIAAWILTGLLINRNFLLVVDSAGEQVAGGITKVTRKVIKILHRKDGSIEEVVEEVEEIEDEASEEDETHDDAPETEEDVTPEQPTTGGGVPKEDESPFIVVPNDEDEEEVCPTPQGEDKPKEDD
ncbi:MAG: DNA translocase FtsK 4TM domain-containing protein, partial [Alistipes sp.]|nr:DNA translocase FtsK 4TM domain-containing protein [Alistipes sp.]